MCCAKKGSKKCSKRREKRSKRSRVKHSRRLWSSKELQCLERWEFQVIKSPKSQEATLSRNKAKHRSQLLQKDQLLRNLSLLKFALSLRKFPQNGLLVEKLSKQEI